jgi:hypothetical protein
VDITTFRCGSEDGTYAQNYVADTRRGIGCNDIVLEGTTEDDFFGINIEAAAIIRDGSAIKLHGGSNTRRALRLHRCLAFALEIIASQRWNADGFIHVSDAANTSGERLVAVAERGGQNTSGRLVIDTMSNIRWGGPAVSDPGEIPGWCVLDLQDPASAVMVTGLVHPQARPVEENARYVHLRIAGPGNPGVTCDIDGLRFANRVARAVRLQDNRRAPIVARGRTLGAQDADPVAPQSFSSLRNGRIDLRGHDFVDIERGVEISQILLEIGQTCTICAPMGEVRVQNGDMLRLAGGRDVEMNPDTTLTLRRVAPDRIHEIARSGE